MAGAAIGRGRFGDPQPLAFQHAIRLEGLGSKGYFAASSLVALKMTGKATDVFLLMGRQAMPGNESRVMALAAGLLLVRLHSRLPDNLSLGIQQLKSRMQGLGGGMAELRATPPETRITARIRQDTESIYPNSYLSSFSHRIQPVAQGLPVEAGVGAVTIVAGQGLVLGDHAMGQGPIHPGFVNPYLPL